MNIAHVEEGGAFRQSHLNQIIRFQIHGSRCFVQNEHLRLA